MCITDEAGRPIDSGHLKSEGCSIEVDSLQYSWPLLFVRWFHFTLHCYEGGFMCIDESVSSVAQSCLTLCDPMDCSTPGFPVRHQLPELAQTHVC